LNDVSQALTASIIGAMILASLPSETEISANKQHSFQEVSHMSNKYAEAEVKWITIRQSTRVFSNISYQQEMKISFLS
jgi:hypothetical protein